MLWAIYAQQQRICLRQNQQILWNNVHWHYAATMKARQVCRIAMVQFTRPDACLQCDCPESEEIYKYNSFLNVTLFWRVRMWRLIVSYLLFYHATVFRLTVDLHWRILYLHELLSAATPLQTCVSWMAEPASILFVDKTLLVINFCHSSSHVLFSRLFPI